MIKICEKTAIFTGRDQKQLSAISKELGLSVQDTFTGMLWEFIMQKAREGVFKKEK